LARVDTEVCRVKFAREVRRLIDQRAALEARGIFLLADPTYPFIEFVLVPRTPLRVMLPAQVAGPIVLPAGAVAMVVAEVPSLAARAFRARFDLTDFDLRAPSLQFLDHWTNQPLDYNTMFRALEYEKDRLAHNVLLDDHPTTHRPFLCLRGVREYHEHPQHSGDEWLLYRVSIDIVRPALFPQPGGLRVNWDAEAKL
jgi:Predicted metal binding domain